MRGCVPKEDSMDATGMIDAVKRKKRFVIKRKKSGMKNIVFVNISPQKGMRI